MKVADIRSILLEARPKKLVSPPKSLDHCDHVVRTALAGHTKLAADHLLSVEMVGILRETVGNIIRQLNLEFIKTVTLPSTSAKEEKKNILACSRAYEVLIQIALNMFGVESKKIGFSNEEIEGTIQDITQALETWESLERKGFYGKSIDGAPIAEAVVDGIISDMKKVMSSSSKTPVAMVAVMGEKIGEELSKEKIMSTFLSAARRRIQENIYYIMVMKGICKFGNDYAIGLRWLRHLGYGQVSTNPVLAAIAYDDDPSLWDAFRWVVEEHPEWFEAPEKYADEIAMQGTMVALWPNLAVYRPIALASKLYDGLVSYQLNPNVADSLEGSVKDALQIYSAAQEFLKRYDEYLMWGYSSKVERGRPNIVFKVAGSSPAAIDITAKLESLGVGTNNTVTYTVPQETTLILAKIEGRAEALKKGIPVTTVYETNMGGRLDDHLREEQAEKLLKETLEKAPDKEESLKKLATKLGAWDAVKKAPSLEEKVKIVCHHRYLRPLNKDPFIDLLAETKTCGGSKEETKAYLSRVENDIGHAGTFVAQRVYRIFFSPENRPKWITYLQKEHGLSEEQAKEVMGKIDMLPASKRKPNDTLFTLAKTNMTNTEFPNHQQNVLNTSRKPDFILEDYENAILKEHNSGILRRLLEESDIREDFRKAYELTPELTEKLRKAGIRGDFGDRGHQPQEWPSFGSVIKTTNQFTNAYNNFKERTVDFVRKVVSA